MVDQVLRAAGQILDVGDVRMDAEMMIQRRDDFTEMNRAVDRYAGDAVRTSDGLAHFHSAAGK